MTASQDLTPARLHGLDTLRAAAIVLVMVYHLNMQGLVPPLISPIAKIGWIGVDLFFVLSGFLIGSQLLKPYLAGQSASLKDFYMRRAYRILPPFFIVLLLYLAVPLWREAPGPCDAWQYLSFTWNLFVLGYPANRAFSHVWSLCIEEHFYLLLPVVLFLFMRKPSIWKTLSLLLFLLVGGVGLRAWLLHSLIQPAADEQGLMMMRYIYYPTYSRLDGLVMGVALAILRAFRAPWWARVASYSSLLLTLGIFFVIGGLSLCAFDYPDPDLPASILFAFPALSCGFVLLVASALCENGVLAKRIPGASTIAVLAFSLYLTHKSVAHATHYLLPGVTAEADWRSFALYTLTCFGAASLLYLGVERPFLNLRARRSLRPIDPRVDGEVRFDSAI